MMKSFIKSQAISTAHNTKKGKHAVNKTMCHKRISGSSILEVLVALFVLAVGLLGVIALQAESLKFNQQSYSSTQALFLANEMAERMRANKGAPSLTTGADVTAWSTQVAERLPGGTGVITPVTGVNDLFTIKITYNQQKLKNEGLDAGAGSGIDPIDYTLTVRL